MELKAIDIPVCWGIGGFRLSSFADLNPFLASQDFKIVPCSFYSYQSLQGQSSPRLLNAHLLILIMGLFRG